LKPGTLCAERPLPSALKEARTVPKRFLQDDEWNNCSSLKAQSDYGASVLASSGRIHGIRLGTLPDSPALQLAANTGERVDGYL
jgi:hypothetical protein